jgi:hypothetical protein
LLRNDPELVRASLPVKRLLGEPFAAQPGG